MNPPPQFLQHNSLQYNPAMTAAPDDDTLGLNLVYTDPSSTTGLGLGGDTTKKPKRKTKYDRRRERGKLAKLAKDDEKRKKRDNGSDSTTTLQQGEVKSINSRYVEDTSKVDVGGGSSSLAGIASLLGGGSSVKEQKKRKIASSQSKPIDTTTAIESTTSSIEDKKEETAVKDDAKPKAKVAKEEDTKTSVRDSGKEESKLEAASPTSAQSTSLPLVENTKPSVSLAVEDTAASSRRHRTQTTLSDEQQAAYLSEFHARPRDLDRSEHASKDIKSSSFSSHLFDTSEVIAGKDEDDRMVVDNEGQTKGETNKSSSTVSLSSCPFAKLGLHPNLVSTLTSPTGNFKLIQPTIVQTKSIAALLPSTKKTKKSKKGKLQQNLFIQSETGSGKTLAYLLPILQHLAVDINSNSLKRIDRKLGGTRCILLCPTRELATQTYTFTSNLCTSSFSWIVPGCFSGGEKRKSEKARLRKGISILIATPGRLLDHLSKTESLLTALKNKLEWVVLDEADRLLDAGLGGQVEQIIQYLRSNQPGAGRKRDGVSWRSVLVSATVNSDLEQLAKTVLGGNGGWMWARGHANQGRKSIGGELTTTNALENGNENNTSDHQMAESNNDNELDHSAPRQLAQLYMVVSAKLRLSSLIAFLSARAAKGERTVVFMSTCDSVDYHYGLFNAMECVLGDDTNKDTNNTGDDDDDDSKEKNGGIFGKTCPIYKLHGDIPHNKRLSTLKAFSNDEHSASILLATDVAARGLNFPSLDWIVQYDPPCETKDYVHRAGRSARAGQAGHALLFLLPSERQYVEVLELRGMKEITSLSLSSTLTSAAELCRGISQEGEAKASGNTFSDGRGEAFTFAIQNRLEECVIQNDTEYKASIDKKFKGDPKQRRKQKKEAVGPLLEGARNAFSAFVRAYPAKEKAVRHIFNARALHLGHIARSLALKETPKMVSKVNNSKNSHNSIEGGGKSNKARNKGGEKRKSRLTFGDRPAAEMEGDEVDDEDDEEQERNLSLLSSAIGKEGSVAAHASKKFKSSSGGTGGGNVQKRMMEAAMRMQAQEFM